MANLYGVSAYQQTNNVWKQTTKKTDETTKTEKTNTEGVSDTEKDIKKNTWKPINTAGPLIPTKKADIGMAIGDVQLSDKAKDYYNKLKSKFGNMEFIAVSQDMKAKVQANVAAYGNANKQVVLIDDAKLEQMANDESFRNKYEGIIAMSQMKLQEAKNSLASSGASVKNFGLSVNSDGTTDFFATIENANKEQAKRMEKKQAEKKAAKIKEKKIAEKKAQEAKLEKTRKEQKEKAEKLKEASEDEDKLIGKEHKVNKHDKDKEYIEIKAQSMDDLIDQVSKYAYSNSERSVMTASEKAVGQQFDFRG